MSKLTLLLFVNSRLFFDMVLSAKMTHRICFERTASYWCWLPANSFFVRQRFSLAKDMNKRLVGRIEMLIRHPFVLNGHE